MVKEQSHHWAFVMTWDVRDEGGMINETRCGDEWHPLNEPSGTGRLWTLSCQLITSIANWYMYSLVQCEMHTGAKVQK